MPSIDPHARLRTALLRTVSGISMLALLDASAHAQTVAAPTPKPVTHRVHQSRSTGPAVTPTNAAAAQTTGSIEGITVTARRRTEKLIDVPLAISVVTSAKLEQLNIRDTHTLSLYVPGLQFSDYAPGDARNDRGIDRILSFRGLAISQAASLFLDGAAVPGKEIPASMDVGQVEVLRGPQSVYFGQSTMTGAVSYRTKPIPDVWGGEFEQQFAERSDFVTQATVAGPVVHDLLGVRLTGLFDKSDGYLTNGYDGSTLGDRDRKSGSATVDLTPTNDLEFKGFFNYFRDTDGVSATPFIRSQYDNCKLPGATETTFCGEIPDASNSVNYSNTTIPASMRSFLFNSPLLRGWGLSDQVGGQRASYNSDIVGNYRINDYLKLTEITAYHANLSTATQDGIGQPVQAGFPYKSYFYTILANEHDFSQEVRLNSDPNRRLSWTAGTNYIDSLNQTQAEVAFLSPTNVSSFYNEGIAATETQTVGLFGGAYYKLTPRLTLSAEGRYQWDERTFIQHTADGAISFDESQLFKSFNPRFSADYALTPDLRLYTSYATGTDPGGFNTTVANYANQPAVLNQISQLLGNSSTAIKEERLRIGELGLKGTFDHHKGYFDINLYYGRLNNQQLQYSALIPLLGYAVSATSNIGVTKIYGTELQGNYNLPIKGLSISGTFAWNHSDRSQFTDASGVAEFGTTNFNNVLYAYVPEFTGSAILAYTTPITPTWNVYSNAAYSYRGRQYVDLYNAAWIGGTNLLDLRLGLSSKKYLAELFVTNVTDERGYVGGSVAPDYGTNTYNAFTGALADPRTFGGRFRVIF